MDDYEVVLQKDGQFIGHGTTDEGIHIECFLFMDGHIRFYDIETGQEIDVCILSVVRNDIQEIDE